MCKFCKKIYKPSDIIDAPKIVYRNYCGNDSDMYYISVPTDDGIDYSIDNIKFCPICGRKLCDETETPIEHFLKSEIERSKLRMNAYAECFDGVHVDNDTRKKLLESHIRFCKNALKQCMDV